MRPLAIASACILASLCLAPALTSAQPDPRDPWLPVAPIRKPTANLARGEFTIAIEGTKTKFKGEGANDATKDKLIGLAFESEVRSPRDAATGAVTGKRIHQPLRFTKEWGAASPQLLQAAGTNEVLKTVTFEFYQAGPSGAVEQFYTMKLTAAAIVGVRQYIADGRNLEEISLTYQKIEVEHKPTKTTGSDDAR